MKRGTLLGLSGKTRTLAYLATHLDPLRYRAIVCSLSDEPSVLHDQLTAADVAMFITVHYAIRLDGPHFDPFPALADWYRRIVKRSSSALTSLSLNVFASSSLHGMHQSA